MSWRSFLTVVLTSVIVGAICFEIGSGYGEKVGEEKNKDKIYTSEEYKKAVDAAWSDGYNTSHKQTTYYDNSGSSGTVNNFYDENDEYSAAYFLEYYGSYFVIDSDADEKLSDAVDYLDDALDKLGSSDPNGMVDFNIFKAQECIYDVLDMISDYTYYYPYE